MHPHKIHHHGAAHRLPAGHTCIAHSAAGARNNYTAISQVEADTSDEAALPDLVLCTTRFRDLHQRSLTVRLLTKLPLASMLGMLN